MMEGDPCDSEDLHGLRMAIREKELCVFRKTDSHRARSSWATTLSSPESSVSNKAQ